MSDEISNRQQLMVDAEQFFLLQAENSQLYKEISQLKAQLAELNLVRIQEQIEQVRAANSENVNSKEEDTLDG